VIKAVVFDLGNVLCRLDWNACDSAFAVHSPLSAEQVGRRVRSEELERVSETGRCDSAEYFRRVKEAIQADSAWTYEEFSEELMRCFIPHPSGERAVVRARELGLRVFILSNTSYLHSRFICSREVLATIPELYALSFKVGVMKPDPAIWKWLLDRSGLEAKECLYFDDIAINCDIGSSLGFRAALHDPETGNLSKELEAMLN